MNVRKYLLLPVVALGCLLLCSCATPRHYTSETVGTGPLCQDRCRLSLRAFE
jgi:hypothetical protein